jgi:hypothetical protein
MLFFYSVGISPRTDCERVHPKFFCRAGHHSFASFPQAPFGRCRADTIQLTRQEEDEWQPTNCAKGPVA